MGGLRRKQMFVPSFTKSTLDLADLCARELWRGKSYQKDVLTISDEELLLDFSSPIYKNALKINKPYKSSITADVVKKFINVAMPAMNLSVNGTDYIGGIKKLNRDVPKLIQPSISKAHSVDVYELAEQIIFQLGSEFHIATNKSFLVLATRILFFATPHLPIFNYSDPLAKALGLPLNRQTESLPIFNELMRIGLEENWSYLKQYQMPFLSNKEQDEKIWHLARDSGWWQRRVLDLACVITLTNAIPKPVLIKLNKTLPNRFF